MISYKPLMHTLIDRGMSREDLKQCAKIGATTASKIFTGKHVALEVLERICLALGVPLSSVVEVLPGETAEAGEKPEGADKRPSKRKGASVK